MYIIQPLGLWAVKFASPFWLVIKVGIHALTTHTALATPCALSGEAFSVSLWLCVRDSEKTMLMHYVVYALLPCNNDYSTSSCTSLTARPLGSFMFLKASSQARASAVEHATLGTLGTERAAESLGKCSAKIER